MHLSYAFNYKTQLSLNILLQTRINVKEAIYPVFIPCVCKVCKAII